MKLLFGKIDFFFVFLLLYYCTTSHAIYDPRESHAVKPAKHRESVIPWYLLESSVQSEASKLDKSEDAGPKKPVVVRDGAHHVRFPDETNSGGQIEQETITDFGNSYDQNQDRRGNFDFLESYDHARPYPSDYQNELFDDNDIDIQEPYEEFAIKTKKSYKDTKVPEVETIKVAKYEPATGAECPTPDATGQFVYPPDCKFFVNCWNGRAFVQPCAPGTLFNPKSLECDFPNKVNCYTELGDLTASDNVPPTPPPTKKELLFHVSGSQREWRVPPVDEKPSCPPWFSGLLPFSNDCTKFLQCANGATFVMHCGPGTVFNPDISVCDWPYNVEGCGKVDVETTIVPPREIFDERGDFSQKEPNHPSIIECPEGQEGLLPHPRDCKKFLQCNHGITHVMDCGPGTVFNPQISTCDWPYNVKGCGETDVETTTVPLREIFDMRGDFSQKAPEIPVHTDVIECPEGQEGLLPHPKDCKKFLQCSRGSTYVMNCGPGTVFNPLISVCDFPYNVKGCGEDEPATVSENVNFGINFNGGQNSYEQSGGRETAFGHSTDSSSLPIDQSFENRENFEHNNNGPGNYYPNKNWHQYDNNRNHGQTYENTGEGGKQQTESSLNTDSGSNWNWNNNRHHQINQGQSDTQDSEGSYSHVSEIEANRRDGQPHGEVGQNTYVDSDYQLPGEVENPNENGNGGVQLPTTTPVPWYQWQTTTTAKSTVVTQKIWNQEETNIHRPGKFEPSTWRGQDNKKEYLPNASTKHSWLQEEPPFPVYYIPSVQPLSYSDEFPQISPTSGQILRLRGGSVLGEGYLEVQGIQSGWGIVCDRRNEWTLKEANIVCKQLGFARGAETAWQGRYSQDESLPSWIAADSVNCVGNETYFQSCEFTHGSECDVIRDAVGIRCLPNRAAYCKQDEVPYRGFCYHLASSDSALNHVEALDYCNDRGSKLLDIIDQSENNFISEWLVQSYPDVGSVMTSGFGFTTLNRTIWLWEDSNHAKFRFTKWWPGWISDLKTPPSVGARPACVVMKRGFPCHNEPDEICTSDYFFWDIEDCAASSKGHSYVCKKAYTDIGCVYGNGQYYLGKANITASGFKCLPWGDESVQHSLKFKVVSEEIREKLREHNYCRNPNPNRETEPWCFTGPNGEYDQCDIPPCAKQSMKRSVAAGQCKPKHFECRPGECIPSPWICDGAEDCTNGADEYTCGKDLDSYTKIEKHRLDGYEVEKWLNTPLKTCALRCREADFTCRSFSHKTEENICLLSDSNVGLTGALQSSEDHDYYEMNERSVICDDMFICENKKCINTSLLCDGKNDCGDRTDESSCSLEGLGYEVRLTGSSNAEEGRLEVKVYGKWGQVCDDGFGMIDAGVACKELGFTFGVREIRSGGFYGESESPLFLMDQVKCRGNETSLRECDFDGWGVHNCLPEEAVGIVCKTGVNICPDGSWKCDNSPECVPIQFICDEVVDCSDGSDEGPEHCEAPFELRLSGGNNLLEGRVEVRHHGIWGTVCDDDFSDASARVICRSLGYGGSATAIKGGAFGPGEGPIWLDQVFCSGNETQLYKCDHESWGRHNCGHDEDAGIRCEYGEVVGNELNEDLAPLDQPEFRVEEILPADCGKRVEDFDEADEYMARVVRGSVAPKGAYPWQASLRIRGHSKSSHWCGAVIISPLYVLTAAHCLEGYNKGTYFVRAGDYHTEIDDGTEVEANIENYYIHEDFRKGQRMNNDIALVLLKGRGIPLGRNVMPICLPPENVEYLPGLNCTISGWGSVESGNFVQSNYLRFGWVPILDQTICQADYVYGEGAISNGMVCAGHLDEGVDSCDGDSGGPLACYHNNAFTLYGLTSWGKHCGEANKPGVYVRIAHYRRWIDSKIKESSSGM